MPTHVNPFGDPHVACRYEQWYAGTGEIAAELEKRLLAKLLAGFPDARTAVEIGCGTGYFTRWLASRGLDVVGLDLSAPMLREARGRGRLPVILGDAHHLPFPGRSFDLAVFITSLEFVADPSLALAEASRVARRGILLGVLNKWSLTALSYRLSGRQPWRSAQFLSPPQLRRMVRASLKERVRSFRWRTTLWPFPGAGDLPLPWGGFIGLAVHLNDGTSQASEFHRD